MAKPDYSHWLTKQQAADAIGCSTKTIEKLAGEKKIQQAYWKRPETGATVSMYHPDDVSRIRLARNPDAEPFVIPDEGAPAAETTAVTAPASQFTPDRLLSVLSAFADTSQNSKNGVRTAERLFLTLAEAADYSGLPQVHIRRLLKEGKIEALKTGSGWRIRRAALEKL
jgi:excisionase family DNA binding protein